MPSEKHDELPLPRRERSWTRPQDYIDTEQFARRAAARQRQRQRPITEAPNPRPSLGLIPFALLMAALAVLAVLIMIAAVPGQYRPSAKAPEQNQVTPIEMDIREVR